MKRMIFTAGYLSLLVFYSLAQSIPDHGIWVGQTDILGNPRFVQVRIEQTKNGTAACMDIPGANALRMPVENLKLTGELVEFVVRSPRGEAQFNGNINRAGIIKGKLSGFGRQGSMHLVSAYNAGESLAVYAGVYNIGNKQKMLVLYSPLNLLDVTIIENNVSQTASRNFSLIPSGKDIFFTSRSAIAPPEDEDEIVQFTRDEAGDVVALSLRQPNGQKVEAIRETLGYSEEQVMFNNKDIRLGGSIYYPKQNSNGIAIILLQGAGPSLRSNWVQNIRARYFAELGFTTLIYDKRGTGNSSGSNIQPTFTEMAEDAIAALHYVKERKDIKITRIGIMGQSESAWTVPVACSLSDEFAFAIISSGGAITNEEASLYEIERGLRNGKFSETEINEALTFTKLKWEYALTGKNGEAYFEMANQAKNKKWFEVAEGPLTKDPKEWDGQRLKKYEDRNYADYIRSMKIPLLLLFGDEAVDDKVPVKKSMENWKALLGEMKYGNFHIQQFPQALHALFLKKDSKGVVVKNNEAFELVNSWILSNKL